MYKKLSLLLLVSGISILTAADQVLWSAGKLSDWAGQKKNLLCSQGVFDTNKSRFRLLSAEKVRISPEKSYLLKGDFKMNTYAPFGNISLGLIFFDEQGNRLKQMTYLAKSPYDDRVVKGNRGQVRRFWMTFQGKIPDGTMKIPGKAAFVKVQLVPHNINIVDILFKNICLLEQ